MTLEGNYREEISKDFGTLSYARIPTCAIERDKIVYLWSLLKQINISNVTEGSQIGVVPC